MTILQATQKVLSDGLVALGLQPNVEVLEIKADRWILAYDQSPDHPDFGNSMLKLETWIRDYSGNREVELMLEAEADKNKRDVRTGRGVKMVNARGVESLD